MAAAESVDHHDEAEQASSEIKEKEQKESYIFPMVTDVCVVDTCKVLIIIITN